MNRISTYQLLVPYSNVEDPLYPWLHLISQQPCGMGLIEIAIPTSQMKKQAQRP